MITPKTQMYEFRLVAWNGVPDRADALYGYSMYPYLDRAWQSMGYKSDCPDGGNRPEVLREIVKRIEPDQHGIYPTIEIVPSND